MTEDTIKLTTYLRERQRVDGGLLADELLGVYGRRQIRVSAMMRGIEGFGASKREHTDVLLALADDLPVITTAVDTRSRIEDAVPTVLSMHRRGLVTLERVRLLGDGLEEISGPQDLPRDLYEAAKITVYVGRHQRVDAGPAFVTVCEVLRRAGVSAATVLLGANGTSNGGRGRARFSDGNSAVPMVIIGIGTGSAVAAALGALAQLPEQPLVTLERINLTRWGGVKLADPAPKPPATGDGLRHWHKLTVYSNEGHRVGRFPLHHELIRRLRKHRLAGATSVRGIWGYHDDRESPGGSGLQARRSTPVMTIAIDTPERLAAVYDDVEQVTADSGIVTLETVPLIPERNTE